MFEGVVHQLLLGYLGRFIKDFQKEQLKITLWNEEVLLENVELMLEAFDYLQFPIALKQGRVGKLSIKIPWKKLGWDPIIILLEDVFFFAGQRDDHEWSSDAVDRRELAAKKAKLATAELEKLSRRVSDHQAGQSFISHIAGKILDNIQVSIRNVHVLYCEGQSPLMQMVFGLRFSSLTIMKQSPVWSSGWKARAGQVSKIVEIHGLGLYCSTSHGSLDLVCVDSAGDPCMSDAMAEEDKCDYIVAPFDASLLVVKSGKLEQDSPQYSVTAELEKLVMSIDAVQLQHILAFLDYLSTCRLREKYGRYRPLGTSLSRKPKGWQKAWWHYAQDSVLSDVRKKLRKSSWRYLGQRLACCRMYVKLYKIKLKFLQKEQPVDINVLRELEQMEKDNEIDDILSFRSKAERELEDSASSSNDLMEGIYVSGEKVQNDDPSSNRPRGWLNWLSRGVLGVGGTDDSSQFSGVVSDEIIKDICEATKFRPMPSVNVVGVTFLSAVNVSISLVSLSVHSRSLGQEIGQICCHAVVIESRIWEGSVAISSKVDSVEILDSFKHIAILRTKEASFKKKASNGEQSSTCLRVDVSSKSEEAELFVKVMLQPLEIRLVLEFILKLMDFYNVLKSFKLQQDRVLTSLNGIKDDKSRLLSKAEYIFSHRQKVTWDVSIIGMSIHIPCSTKDAEPCSMVFEAGTLRISSKSDNGAFASDIEDQSFNLLGLIHSSNMIDGSQWEKFYAHFDVSLNDFEIGLLLLNLPEGISVVEKVCASVTLASCVIPDEMMLKELEAHIVIPSVHVHFSPSIYGAILEMAEHLHRLHSKSEEVKLMTLGSHNFITAGSEMPFCYSLAANLELVEFKVNLEDDVVNSSVIVLSLGDLDMRHTHTEFEDSSVFIRSMKIISYQQGAESDSQILCSSRVQFIDSHLNQHGVSNQMSSEQSRFGDGCFRLYYKSHISGCVTHHICDLCLNDAELHCYPSVFRLLVGFFDKLEACHTLDGGKDCFSNMEYKCSDVHSFHLERFGLSKSYENGLSGQASICWDQFPFLTIYNSGSLRNLESSLICPIPEWRSSFSLIDKRKTPMPEAPDAPVLKFLCGEGEAPLVGSSRGLNIIAIDLDVSGIKLHFHDSSCIVGTVTVPVGKASITRHRDCLDALCSIEGFALSSPLWTRNFLEFLWGPLVSNESPILNLRARKGNSCSSNSSLELSISIQHVCCIIPPEYLAIIIGYFSLPDWTTYESDHLVIQNNGYANQENDRAIIYKVEVLDSILLSPTASSDKLFLKLECQQLYCSFIENDASENALDGILSECLIPAHKISHKTKSVNLFGLDLHLYHMLFKDCGNGSSMFYETVHESSPLIQSLNADLWIRIPYQNQPQSVTSQRCSMVRIASCEILVEGRYAKSGCDALLDVIDQYSSVEKESKLFHQDVSQFLQLKRSLKDNPVILADVSSTLTEIKCCATLLSLKLNQSDSPEVVARIDTGFTLSASLKSGILLSLDVHFSSLTFYSLITSTMLAKCCSNDSAAVLEVHLSTLEDSEVKLLVSLPSFEIWLHLSDWKRVIDVLGSYSQPCPQPLVMDESNLTSFRIGVPQDMEILQDSLQSQRSTSTESENLTLNAVSTESEYLAVNAVGVTVLLESIGLSCHIPVWVSKETYTESEKLDILGKIASDVSNVAAGAKQCKFLTIAFHTRSSELFIKGSSVKLMSNIEKATGSMGTYEGSVIHSWPLFQLCHLSSEFEVCDYHCSPVCVKANMHWETFDLWLSHQALFFWNGIEFQSSKADSTEFMFDVLDLRIQSRKVSLLLTDGRWGCNGPLVELVLRNLLCESNITGNSIQGSVVGDLLVNYSNIRKASWEPFVEPWNFQVLIARKRDRTALLGSATMNDIYVISTAQLNLNFTEPLLEVISRAIEMIMDTQVVMQLDDASKSQRFQNSHFAADNLCSRRYAPYVIHNMTSLPIEVHVYQGLTSGENFDVSASKHESAVPSGSLVPIYVDESLEEQVFNCRPPSSSDGLSKKQSSGLGHHFMTIQFEGTSEPSEPILMDLVGLTYFEVDFSKDHHKATANTGFLVPVVFDVSVERYSKHIRLYSTVILLNSTSMPLELRFDIPFGISPKIVDPVYPGQEFPLPLHLAEVGRIRWRPLGDNYLWSESHNLSNMLSQESRSGFLRSIVCYPSHPNSDPFRCCLSVEDRSLPFSGRLKKSSIHHGNGKVKHTAKSYGELHNFNKLESRFIHHVTLNTPLLVKNYLAQPVSLTIESGGVGCAALLGEVETSFFHIDSSHDLGMTFHITGFKPSSVKFPRAETFGSIAKFNGAVLSLTESVTFNSDLSDGLIYVTVEKAMDASSGARELCISVPFLLYNCTGFALSISRSDQGPKGNCCTVPSCYESIEHNPFMGQKDGLGLISSGKGMYPITLHFGNQCSALSKSNILFKDNGLNSTMPPNESSVSLVSPSPQQTLDHPNFHANKPSLNSKKNKLASNNQSDLTESDSADIPPVNVKPFIYSPDTNIPPSETMIRVSRCLPDCATENQWNSSWSNSFFLVAPSGSTTVVVPLSSNFASVISVTSSRLDNPFSGRTRAISFQPRYVISNACSKELCYKQKGTDFIFHLDSGQHSHLHWPDVTRELLVSVRFDEPGWQWSGSFSPDDLGDKQVKMRNYVSGALNMIRVEVQNADVVIQDEKIIGNSSANSGTNFILLSDDDTGFIPYRIDNFSKETLRIYQQKCESLETLVHPYTSCPYAWDEPCYPHRLIVEVPGERIVGSYALDNVREYGPVNLPSSFEKRERTLLSSVHAEGAMKVLSIVDSTCHVLREMKDPSSGVFGEKRKQNETDEKLVDYKDNISVTISFIGISLINSTPQELLFACAKDIKIVLSQNVEQQQISFQILSLQIDNQLRSTPYPVAVSFDQEQKGNLVSHMRSKDDSAKSINDSLMQFTSGSSCEPVIWFSASKWGDKEMVLVSIKHISLRIADFHLELDQELLLVLLDYFRAVVSTFHAQDFPYADSSLDYYLFKTDKVPVSSACALQDSEFSHANGYQNSLKFGNFPQRYHTSGPPLPKIVPIGAPWQKIYLLARRQNKIYVEAFYLAPIKLTLSFSSNPWMLKNGALASGESLIRRGLMALADIEGAQINLRKLKITHHMASWKSIREILIKHYTKQFLHEMYKVFGSAGVIGNPMGFARSVGLGVKDFLSVPAQGVLQSPAGLITGMARGTTSLLSNTLYAISDAATQFSKAAHKGILAFTFDNQDSKEMEKQQIAAASHSKGVISELLEGLTGLLQSPVRGAEKHGLPGVLSGFALGVTGLVARPAASVLEVTGKTARSIRNRSRLHRMGHQRFRVRLPRPLRRELPLRPYSWEAAVGTAVLVEAYDGSRFKDEVLIMCKFLKDPGKFVVLTERLILIVECLSLVELGKPEFRGISADPEWIIEVEIGLESVIHVDAEGGVIHIVGSGSEVLLRQNQQHQRRPGVGRPKRWNEPSTSLPLFQTNLELATEEEADYILRVLLSTIEQGREQGWGNVYLLHQSNLK
ncbi:hypothetical protein Ancab_001679 [Ancistrocladus abbreviatus]